MFKNFQWAVTENGMDTVKPEVPYDFNAERLTETTDRANGTFYDWPVHMAEKTWVNVEAFNEAFKQALEFHKSRYSPAVDPKMLEATFKEARRIAKEARRSWLPKL